MIDLSAGWRPAWGRGSWAMRPLALLLLYSASRAGSSSDPAAPAALASLEAPQRPWRAQCERPRPPLSGKAKRVLVTGAAGFIGSHVAQHCAETLVGAALR